MVGLNTNTLADALALHGRVLPPGQIVQLESYCQLLWDWNRRLNLTRHTDYPTFVARDVTDSQALAELLEPNEEVLDVGTGGGVPGIVLAILRSDVRVSLCESVTKKSQAVGTIVEHLGLDVPVYNRRAEHLLDDYRFQTLVARAVGPLDRMLTWFAPHWSSIGRLLIVKGPRWVAERQEARHRGLFHQLQLRRVATYTTPGTDVENVILQVSPRRDTPAQS